MHGAGARAAPDGSARAAHRNAAAPLASEHGGGVTERVATLLLSLHRGIIRRPAVCTCRPPVRLDLCVGGFAAGCRCRGGFVPPPARIFSDSLQGPARARTRERKSLAGVSGASGLCPWRCAIVRLESCIGSIGCVAVRPFQLPPLSELRVGLLLGDRTRIGASLRSDHRNGQCAMAFFGLALGCPHRIGQVEKNHAIKINTDLE